MARTTIATDDFNRASLGSDYAQINTGLGGVVLINSSIRVAGQYDSQPPDDKATARRVTETFSDDQFASLQITNINDDVGASNKMGVGVRIGSGTDGSKSLYEVVVSSGPVGNKTVSLNKWVSGTKTTLHSASVAFTNNDYISLEVIGTTLTAMKNGVAFGGSFTQTDSSLTTGRPGLVCASTSTYGEDATFGDVTASTPVLDGDFTLADLVFSGTFATGALSQLAGGFTLDDFLNGGVMGLAPGIVATEPFKNWSGTLLPGVTVPNVVFLKLDRTTAVALVNQTTAGDGVMTVANAALVAGTFYIMVSFDATGASIGAELVQAT